MASDEPREHYGAEKGTKEYEIRVERYLTGDTQSRDLLRRALLVDGTNDEELHQSFEERRHVIYERYLFGIPAKSLQASEGKLRSDPRLADRRWKDLLKRYMAEVFFGLPDPKDVRSSQRFFDYVETLGAFARELSQIESESDAQDMETRFASMIDSIIEFAADSASETVRLVNEAHSRAEYTYQRIIDAYMIELKSMGLDSEQFHNTLDDYTFAVQQVSRPLSRNGDRIRAELAERRAKRKPDYKPKEKATDDKSRIASNNKGGLNADSAPRITQESKPTMADHLGSGRDRRPGSRFGPPPAAVTDTGRSSDRRPSQRFGPPQPPKLSGTPDERKARSISRYDGPDRIQIVIHGSSDTYGAVQKFMKKVGIDDFFYSRSFTTTTVYTKDARTVKELATEIDFGDVTAVDDARRVISVTWTGNG